MVSDDESPEADDGPAGVPCSELILLVETSRAGTEQDLQCLAQVVLEWTLRVRAARHEWMPPAQDHKPPPWHAEVVHASPLSFEVEVYGAYFSTRLLQDLVDAVHAAHEQGVPIARISYG
jgi:hypothetical protein